MAEKGVAVKKQRFWEIDLLRGLAIVGMIAFNCLFALYYLGVYGLNPRIEYAYMIASTFIFLSGVSMSISYSNGGDFGRFFLRGLKIFSLGAVITLVTFLAFPQAYIVFGILHFIGLSTIIGYFFLRFSKFNLLLGVAIIFSGIYLYGLRFDFSWLLWLGFQPSSFYTFYYFPILPWFGVTLLGIAVGNHFYKDGKRLFRLGDMSKNVVVRFLSFLGRNSLRIYLIHQPVLLAILMLLGYKIF